MSLYVFCFGLIMIVALMNPEGFLVVLEVFTSLSLNIEGGALACRTWSALPHASRRDAPPRL